MGSNKKGKPLTVTLELSEEALELIRSRQMQLRETEAEAASSIIEERAVREKAIAQEGSPNRRTKAERLAAFEEHMAEVRKRAGRYPPGYEADDSRESIYEGRGG